MHSFVASKRTVDVYIYRKKINHKCHQQIETVVHHTLARNVQSEHDERHNKVSGLEQQLRHKTGCHTKGKQQLEKSASMLERDHNASDAYQVYGCEPVPEQGWLQQSTP